ncbi:MAG: peroxide stress protein YaaA [Candidatus Limnocylindrales bacterium]
MLILVPPSESKRPPADRGRPVDLEALSFPELTPMRRQVLAAVMATSAEPDAFQRLHARPSAAPEVVRNTWLADVPAMPVLDVYTGPLHAGLGAASWSDVARERAERGLVVVSPVFGALRPIDRIPPYRVHVCARLVGIGRVEPAWRTVLPDVLAAAAGEGIVIDLRSEMVQALGKPTGLEARTVTLRVDRGPRGQRIGDVIAKRVRGEAARHLLEVGAAVEEPHDLADVLAARWPVRLDAPPRPGRGWTLTLRVEV